MKLTCEATCTSCYFSGGRRQTLNENDLIWFCSGCNRFYFCETGLVRLGSFFSCSFCNTSLIKEEVDKIVIAKNLTPIHRSSKDSHELYHEIMETPKTKKSKLWGRLKQKRPISAFEHSKISELNDIDGLNIPLILNVTQSTYELNNVKKLRKYKNKKNLLLKLAEQDSDILAFLYSALFQHKSCKEGLELRYAVYCSEHYPEIKQILFASNSSQTEFDLKLIDSEGKEIWVYCLDENIDLDNLESLVSKALAVDFKKHNKILRVFLVAKSFSYVAKKMIKKYQSILTGIEDGKKYDFWHSVPITLWQPKELTVPGEIIFENVSL